MSKLKKNIIVNFIGKGWASFIILIFAPLYIKFLGIAAYGIIGFFITLKALLILFDFGISTTINRQLAQYSVLPDKADEARDMVRSLEYIYWTIGITLGTAIWFLSPYIAFHWIKGEGLDDTTLLRSVQIMSLILALQWPFNFYKGGLLGLQRQVLLNIITIITSTLSAAGGVLVIWLIKPDLILFFKWQIFVSVIQVLISHYFLWANLPSTTAHRPQFNLQLLKKVWKFVAGLSLTALMILILKQLDKVLLVRFLDLQLFGYYMLSVTVGTFLNALSVPTNYALFPRFSELIARDEPEELRKLYHRATQFMSILIFPAAFLVFFFSKEILLIWLQNSEAAQIAGPIVSIFLIGTALNNITGLAYDIQLAHGWTKLGFLKNFIAVIILVPAIIWAAKSHGAIGAAWIWVALNLGYFLIEIPIMHTRILKDELRQWYTTDVLIPVCAAGIVSYSAFCYISITGPLFIKVFELLGIYLVTLSATVLSTPYGRTITQKILIKIRENANG